MGSINEAHSCSSQGPITGGPVGSLNSHSQPSGYEDVNVLTLVSMETDVTLGSNETVPPSLTRVVSEQACYNTRFK